MRTERSVLFDFWHYYAVSLGQKEIIIEYLSFGAVMPCGRETYKYLELFNIFSFWLMG